MTRDRSGIEISPEILVISTPGIRTVLPFIWFRLKEADSNPINCSTACSKTGSASIADSLFSARSEESELQAAVSQTSNIKILRTLSFSSTTRQPALLLLNLSDPLIHWNPTRIFGRLWEFFHYFFGLPLL